MNHQMNKLFSILCLSLILTTSAQANHFGLMFRNIPHASTLTTNSWIGATNGTWSTASNWSALLVPNGTNIAANISKVGGATGTINLDVSPVINQVLFPTSATLWTISTANSSILTFDGSSPVISGLSYGTISAPIQLNQGLTIQGSLNLGLSAITANNQTITQNSTGTVTLNTSNASTIVAGTYNLSAGNLTLSATNALGNSGGMTLAYSNNAANSQLTLSASSSTFANPINFNDVGSNNFSIGGGNGMTLAGAFTGTVKHGLGIVVVTLNNDLSGLNWSGSGSINFPSISGGVTSISASALASLSPTFPITIGGPTLSASMSCNGNPGSAISQFNTTTTFPNPITINSVNNPGYSCYYGMSAGTGGVLSGPILFNSNSITPTGFYWQGTNPATISGVISSGGTQNSNFKFNIDTNTSLTLSGVNTYSNATNIYGTLNVTGSNINSLNNFFSASATLMGSGTVGPVSGATAGATIKAYSLVTPLVSQVLTVAGNLTENASTNHYFYEDASNNSSVLQVNGNVTLNGTVSQYSYQPGTFTILKYTGTRTGTWTTSINGGSLIFDDANKQVILTVVDNGTRLWIGANNANWSVASNWNPPVIPNSSTIIAVDSVLNNGPALNSAVTVNQLKFTSGGSSNYTTVYNSAGSLTFDGANATLDLTGGGTGSSFTFSNAIKLNQDLIIPASGQTAHFSGVITSNGHNFTQSTSVSGNNPFYFDSSEPGIVGGNYYLNSGYLAINSSTGLGGATGPTIVMGNAGTYGSILASFTSFANNVSFSDTGTQPFILAMISATMSGNFSGALSHDLTIRNSGTLSGNWSGVSSSSTITIDSGALVIPSTFPSSQIVLGKAASAATLNIPSNFANNVNVTGGGSSNGLTSTAAGAVTFSGNIVLNSDSNPAAGSWFTLTGTNITESGIISNGTSNAASELFKIGAGSVNKFTLTGMSTYTSPTSVAAQTTLEVNGSIGSSSLVSLASTSVLQGSGTVGPVTAAAGTEVFNVYSSTPAATQVLTVNGNLIETGTVTHNFYVGSSNASSMMQVNGNVTLNGAVNQNSYTQGTFIILKYTGTRTGTWTTSITGGSLTFDDTNKQVLLTVTDPGYRTYVGPASGNYSLASNWSPNIVPNSTTSIADLNTASGGGVLTFDISPVLNQLNINSTAQWVLSSSNSNSLTMGGVNPIISSSGSAITYMQVPITFNADTAFNLSGSGNLNFYAFALTAASRNFNVNNTGTGSLIFSSPTAANITGGNLNILSGNVTVSQNQALGGSAGSTIVLSNAGTLAPSFSNAVSSSLANKIVLSDIGTKNFLINSNGSASFTGSFTGSISHDVIFTSCQLPSLNSLTLTGAGRVVLASTLNSVPVGFNPAIELNLGDGNIAGNAFSFLASSTTINNPIKIRPSTTAAGVIKLDAGPGSTIAGNIVINPDSNAFPGSIVRMGTNGNSYTIASVISNGATGSANVTLDLEGAALTFTGASTATNPVTIGDFTPITLNGTWNSSVVNLIGTYTPSPGTLGGKGTINGNVTLTGASQVLKSSDSSASDTFTINGNLTMNATGKFHPRAAGGTTVSTLQVNGNVNFGSSSTNIVVFDGAVPTHGTYNIIKFTGTRTGTLTAPASPAGSTITYDDTAGAGKVILTVP
jgi:fibronectin-binding autotransporter adhesin